VHQTWTIPAPSWAAAGLRLTHVAGDRVEGVIDLGPAHHTPWGVVHGGVYTAAIESAASVGATAAVADRGQVELAEIIAEFLMER
jgi:1,4-dihydroxy-2-naphthoyl-CoA hydrolase